MWVDEYGAKNLKCQAMSVISRQLEEDERDQNFFTQNRTKPLITGKTLTSCKLVQFQYRLFFFMEKRNLLNGRIEHEYLNC